MNFFGQGYGGNYPQSTPPPSYFPTQLYPQQQVHYSTVSLGYPQQIHNFSTPPPMIQSRSMTLPYIPESNSMHNLHHPTNIPFNNNQIVMQVDPKYQHLPPPNYQLSTCQGRKRALLIGINYFGTPTELRGCINDVYHVKQFLITLYNFREQDMVILTDDQINPKSIPTKHNIIQAMQWLVHDSRPNDSYFFHFSGHGGRMKDYDNDEDDGYDETIYPVDHAIYGQIVDDMMNDIMVKPLVPGCRLTAVFDSCHSGTALDLPYTYSTQGSLKEYNVFKDMGTHLRSAGAAYFSGNPSRAISSLSSFGSRLFHGGGSSRRFLRNARIKGSPADVIMFSGCKDDQTSADITEGAIGAMSYALIASLTNNRNQSYLQLLNSIRQILKQKYQQRPQLSSSHPMDMNLLFFV